LVRLIGEVIKLQNQWNYLFQDYQEMKKLTDLVKPFYACGGGYTGTAPALHA
jgi:hypothetical protein